jgi:hypothetical protein
MLFELAPDTGPALEAEVFRLSQKLARGATARAR